jgi:hypothetical protein
VATASDAEPARTGRGSRQPSSRWPDRRRFGQRDLQRHQLIAARAVLAGEALALEPQRLARTAAGATVSMTAPSAVGTLTLAPFTASSSVTGRSSRILSPRAEERVRRDLDDDQSRRLAPPGPGSPLPESRIWVPSSTPLGSLRSMVLPSARVMRWVGQPCRIGQRNLEAVLDVAATRGRALASAGARAATHAAASAEQAFEDVAEVHRLAAAETLGAKAARPPPPGPPPYPKPPIGIAVDVDLAAIELGALVLVGQQVIGARHFAEALGRLGIVLVGVGVQLLGELAIGGLDVLLARAARNAQDGIWIFAMMR